MGCNRKRWCVPAALATVLAVAIAPAMGAGFAIVEQGNKANGLSAVFTARADDPSTQYYNVGGLGLLEGRQFQAGLSLIFLGDSTFEGANPFPGEGTSGEQKKQLVTPPHFYWVEPITDKINFGLAVNAPYGLVTEWDNPDEWVGRFLSVKAELTNIDINPNVGFKLGEKWGLGVGIIFRGAMVELLQRSAAVNPLDGLATEVAKVKLESDMNFGYGLNLGVVHRTSDFFNWGFTYKSEVKVDFTGHGELTQQPSGDPVFDGIVAGLLPFDEELPIETSIDFPATASLGALFNLTDALGLEAQLNWTGWSSFDTLVIDFTENPGLTSERPQGWDDALRFGLGLTWDTSEKNQWRFGAYYDESPQPDETVSPLLPDANRVGISAGWGHFFNGWDMDLAAMYIVFDERTTTTNIDNFNGTYNTNVAILGATFGWGSGRKR